MTKQAEERVDLQRDGKRKKGVRWGLIVLALVVVGIIILIVWLFGRRIVAAFEPDATLPPEIAAEDAAAGEVLYQTNFDAAENFADWELFDDGFVSAYDEDGRLVVSVNALEDTGTWSGLNFTIEDFVLDVDATKLEGPDDNGIIIVFRLTDTSNYNRFDVSSDGFYTLTRVREGLPQVVSDWGQSEAILAGGMTNHIRVTAQGNSFQFAVNETVLPLCISPDSTVQALWDPFAESPTCLGGEVIDTWVDGDLPRGKVGLGAQGFVGFDGEQSTSATAVIGFDNLIIQAPSN